jgi:riboflavin synthase
VTTWGERQAGDKVNIEVDQMARYAARLMRWVESILLGQFIR